MDVGCRIFYEGPGHNRLGRPQLRPGSESPVEVRVVSDVVRGLSRSVSDVRVKGVPVTVRGGNCAKWLRWWTAAVLARRLARATMGCYLLLGSLNGSKV